MRIPWIDRRLLLSQLGTAMLLGVGGGIGLWLGLTPSGRGPTLLAGVVLAATVLSGIIWQYRVHAARQWRALMDAYAEREMAQTRRRDAPRVQPVSLRARRPSVPG